MRGEGLPTEPGKLTVTLRDRGGAPDFDRPTRADEWPMVQFFLSGLLRAPALPNGLRPAAFEALAAVPGVKVLPEQTDADGRTGIGIQYVGKPGTPWADGGPVLVFDARTYRYLGTRDERTAGGRTYEQCSYVQPPPQWWTG
ncbi:hypothetical protein [Streptomyces bullii]|uniref:Uncharacterized protein n=1 Tax=Streptomyces bullii TaxID=349910 RepID=A0ABW0UWY9_9ACTN